MKIHMAKVEKQVSAVIMKIMKSIFAPFKALFTPSLVKDKTILVIDDSEVDRTFALRALAKRYNVIAAVNGQEGIDLALKERPDLIVLDHLMPGMNGIEVCHLIKQNERLKDIPLIFLTSVDTSQNVLDSLEEGAEAYLVKPVSARDLLEQVALRISPLIYSEKSA